MPNMLDMSDVRIVPVWLACRFDVPKAMILKQAHWMMRHEYNRVTHEERVWFKRGMDAWQSDLPMYSKRTLERHLSELEDEGLILSTTYLNRIDRPETTDGYYRYDQTKWYTVVMEHERLNVYDSEPQETILDDTGPHETVVDDKVSNAPDNVAGDLQSDTIAGSPDKIAGSPAKVADSSSIKE